MLSISKNHILSCSCANDRALIGADVMAMARFSLGLPWKEIGVNCPQHIKAAFADLYGEECHATYIEFFNVQPNCTNIADLKRLISHVDIDCLWSDVLNAELESCAIFHCRRINSERWSNIAPYCVFFDNDQHMRCWSGIILHNAARDICLSMRFNYFVDSLLDIVDLDDFNRCPSFSEWRREGYVDDEATSTFLFSLGG